MIEKRRLILDESNDNEDMDENASSDNEAQEGSASTSGGEEPPTKRTRELEVSLTRDQRAVAAEAKKLA